MAVKTKIEEAVEWYRADSPLYEELALLVESVLKEMLKQKKVSYHTITHRAKLVERYKEKASKEKYKDPRSEIMDMAGVRVITYIDSDAKKAEEIVRSLFKIIPEHSKDKTEELGTDRVGYRSIHCVCTLGEDRLALPENNKFKDRCFEIQIRTILQHAWAEFEHDRNYKFKGVLPNKLKRRLTVVAGNLELLDWTFESIANSIDEYTIGVHQRTAKGDLNTRITSASLKIYLGKKFKELVEKGLYPFLFDDAKIIRELSTVRIETLEQLDKAIPEDFVKVSVDYNCIETYAGILRDIMMIFDAKSYFEHAWQKSWNSLSPGSVNLLKHYGVQIDDYVRTYNLNIEEHLPDYEVPDYEMPEYEPDFEPPEEEPPDYEPTDEEPDFEPPEEEPPDYEPTDEEPDFEPPEEEPPDYEPTDEEPGS